LHGITRSDTHLRIGAAVGLQELADDLDVQEVLPALAYAASRIASPQIRKMGTLGGNINLDTRCRYINQSELWREALGGCLKSHGTECHVVPGGQGCVAALSADTVPPLIVYGAVAEIASKLGTRKVPVQELFQQDGTWHVRIAKEELLLAVEIPIPSPQTRVAYRKWAVRQSIDFPLVSVAVRLDLADGKLTGGLVAVGALGPRPRVLPLGSYAGRELDEDLAQAIAQMIYDRARPLPNIPYDTEYRRERMVIEVRRAVRVLAGLPEKPLA
jgi:4-hydroxybenzoyl-CoA reductase beta subunit